jgi:hypothetical protein
LDRQGYCLIEERLSGEEFLELGTALGTIVRDEAIRLFESARRVHRPERIELHTDPPHVDVVAWHSIIEGEPPVPSEILALAEVLAELGDVDLEPLARVEMTYPDPVDETERAAPLLSRSGDQMKFFCIPWYAGALPDLEAATAWNRFLEALERARRAKTIRLDLHAGQALLLNNRTHLHGRAAVPPASKRFLRRLWIANREIAGLPER